MHDHEAPVYPRPQLARARWIDLRGEWGFTFDDSCQGLDERWQERSDVFQRTIQVPFPPESPASGIGDTTFHPVVWYRRSFSYTIAADERLHLHCGAVDYRSHVWVNGTLVATHEGGNTPFSADITIALRPNGNQVIVVRAEDDPFDLAQPRGKQDWQLEPHLIWYHRTTGIWQPIWLEPVAATHVTDVRWTPDVPRGVLGVSVDLNRGTTQLVSVRVQLRLRDKTLADDVYSVQGSTLQREIAIDRAGTGLDRDELLWSPSHPNIIEATLTVLVDNAIVDQVRSYAGMRSVGVTDGRFLLNGRPYFLRLVLEQGYWPDTHLAAPSDEAIQREVQWVKDLGFNGVRIHQKVEDPRFLYWCDRLGVLVWGEMANAYVFSTVAMERLTREWVEVIHRDFSHPCIVAWVPINESWGVPELPEVAAQRHYVQALYHTTQALDPTRPVIGNDGWEHVVGDILSVHDYSFQGETLNERYGDMAATETTIRQVRPGQRQIVLGDYQRQGVPVMITEFGGISYQPDRDAAWFGYGTVADRDAYLSKYRELTEAIIDSPAIAGFCYTQLTDTRQETNGLLSEDRVPKLDPAALFAINSRTAASVPGIVSPQIEAMLDVTNSASPAGESQG